MLIRHLNLAFRKHGRWLFGLFTIVIIVSFIGFMVPGQFGVGGCHDPMAQALGTAFGEPVSYQEARRTLEGQIIVYELLTNRAAGQFQHEEEQAFWLVAQLRAAKARGIAASDQEMADLIERMPAFQKDDPSDQGDFDERMKKELRRRGISGQDFAEALANAIVLEKLQQEEMAAVVATPGEARAYCVFLNTAFRIRTASFRAADYIDKVDTSDDALKAYFEQNGANYRIPAKLTARIVEFPYDDPEALAEGQKITEEELQTFYEKYQRAFAEADGQVPELAKIRDKVRAELAAAKVRDAVNDKALRFAGEASDLLADEPDPQAAFEKLVADYKAVCVETPAVFYADALRIGTLEEPDLVRQIDMANATSPITNPVFGRRGACVGYLLAREEERPAKLEEVTDKVKADLIARRSAEMALADARAAHDRVLNAPEKRGDDPCWNGDATFKLADYLFRIHTAEESRGLPPPALAQLAVPLADGGITEPVTTAEGTTFALVVGRTAADPAEYEKDADLWKMLWFQQKAALQSHAFEQYLMANCQLKQREK